LSSAKAEKTQNFAKVRAVIAKIRDFDCKNTWSKASIRLTYGENCAIIQAAGTDNVRY
jgi:hypothetical protein